MLETPLERHRPLAVKAPITESLPSEANHASLGLRADVKEATSDSASSAFERRRSQLLVETQALADEIAARANNGVIDAPLEDLDRLAALGLLTAPLPVRLGGAGLGTEAGSHLTLLRLIAILGGANLVLARLYEGHVNALILVASYGSESQLVSAAKDAASGLLFGVWNTGGREPMRISKDVDAYTLQGIKTFASGARFVRRPVVTGELEGAGWQMTLPPMESQSVHDCVKIDSDFWKPLGMEGSESYRIDFSGAKLSSKDLFGKPGDFYRDPLFRGGAVRFAAAHAGAVIRLHRLFANWLQSTARGNDPYQIARLGEIALDAQEAALWIERAADIAEKCLHPSADKLSTERMVECANMTRVAIERIATRTMQKIITGVGAHGLLQPSPFERIIRDLTMYLRQPAPDQALADIGKASLRKHNLRAHGAENGLWRDTNSDGSLPPAYFQNVYQKSKDPWNFETSDYESAKYQNTLSSLPSALYNRALEIGCSIGVLTRQLGARCQHLMALDVSEDALAIARKRCADQKHVEFFKMQVPHEMPAGYFDLVLVSEVAYYWSREDLDLAMQLVAKHQQQGAHLVLVHFTVPVPDYPLTGDQVHESWLIRPEWKCLKSERHEGYRLDVLERTVSSEDLASPASSLLRRLLPQ